MPRTARLLVPTILLGLVLGVVGATSAVAAPTVSRAELRSGQLRIEGRTSTPNVAVTVASPTAGESSVTRNSDGSGSFRIEVSGFRSSTCRATVTDPSGSTSTALDGCTPSTPPPSPTPSPTAPPPSPSGSCTITPEAPATYNVGDLQTYFWSTTGCRTSEKPVQWSLVSGRIPDGMSGPHLQGVGSGFVTGRPTTVGSFTFTVRVRDQVGATDTETFTIHVEPARPITVTTQGFSNGRVGEFYCCGNLFADGGVPPYTWAITAGAIPPGLSLQRSPGRITGTPTTAGSFTFTVRPTDSRGVRGEAKQFTLVVEPRA